MEKQKVEADGTGDADRHTVQRPLKGGRDSGSLNSGKAESGGGWDRRRGLA